MSNLGKQEFDEKVVNRLEPRANKVYSFSDDPSTYWFVFFDPMIGTDLAWISKIRKVTDSELKELENERSRID